MKKIIDWINWKLYNLGNNPVFLPFLVMFTIFCLWFFSSCSSTKIVEVPKVETYTEYVDKYVRDTVYYEVYTIDRIKADTVYRTETKYKYVEHIVKDTAYICQIDSIPYPVKVEVTKEVKPPYLTFLQEWFWITLFGIIIFIVIKFKR